MHFLESYYKTVTQYDLINKFNNTKIKNLPKFKKITLNFKTKDFKLKTFAATLFTIELITKKKCTFTTSKKPNIFLKIQKGQPVGGKIVIKKDIMYHFLLSLMIEIFPKIQNSIKFSPDTNNNLSIKLNNNDLTFFNLKNHHHLLELMPYINITIKTNSKTKKELFFLLRSFQFNLKL